MTAIQTTNRYAAFVALAVRLLGTGGELVAIMPRSFCNGTYFKPFRRLFLDSMTFRRIHVFDSRNLAFQDNQVLQENIFFHAVKRKEKNAKIGVSTSGDAYTEDVLPREVSHEQLIHPSDPNLFIHIVSEEYEQNVRDLRSLKYPSRVELESLGARMNGQRPEQEELDRLIEKELLGMADDQQVPDAPAVKRRMEEALTVRIRAS